MLRTAIEILKENAFDVEDWTSGFKADIVDAINQARKEALNKMGSEIAEYYLSDGISSETYNSIQSKILSLIHELK